MVSLFRGFGGLFGAGYFAGRLLVLQRFQRANPDVAIVNGVAVELELKGAFFGELVGVFGHNAVAGGAFNTVVVLGKHAVLNYRDVRRFRKFAIGVAGRVKDNVVGLPFAGRTAGVHFWRILAIEGAALSVGIGAIFVAVEHLDLELAHKENARIAASLAGALGGKRR